MLRPVVAYYPSKSSHSTKDALATAIAGRPETKRSGLQRPLETITGRANGLCSKRHIPSSRQGCSTKIPAQQTEPRAGSCPCSSASVKHHRHSPEQSDLQIMFNEVSHTKNLRSRSQMLIRHTRQRSRAEMDRIYRRSDFSGNRISNDIISAIPDILLS